MGKVTLRLRNLDDGEGRNDEHDSFDAAEAWLAKRPAGMEVLGVVFEGLTREQNDRLKKAMRPLDDEEKAKAKKLEDKDRQEREERAAERRKEAEEGARKMREAAKNAPPTRPMEVRYRFDAPDLDKTDQLDDRPINDDIRAAVKAFVEERNEWVAGRGQTVGEAKVTVYPLDVPAGKERVISGTFVPVTAPEKK